MTSVEWLERQILCWRGAIISQTNCEYPSSNNDKIIEEAKKELKIMEGILEHERIR